MAYNVYTVLNILLQSMVVLMLVVICVNKVIETSHHNLKDVNEELVEENNSLVEENSSLTRENFSLTEENSTLTKENEMLKSTIKDIKNSMNGTASNVILNKIRNILNL